MMEFDVMIIAGAFSIGVIAGAGLAMPAVAHLSRQLKKIPKTAPHQEPHCPECGCLSFTEETYKNGDGSRGEILKFACGFERDISQNRRISRCQRYWIDGAVTSPPALPNQAPKTNGKSVQAVA